MYGQGGGRLAIVESWLWSGALYVDVKASVVASLPCTINTF